MQDPKYEDTTSTCDPEDTTATGAPIVPCGLIAWSLFNDTYTFSSNKKDLVVNKKDISWKSDRDGKFSEKVYPKNFQSGTLIGGGKLDPNKPVSHYVITPPISITFLGLIDTDLVLHSSMDYLQQLSEQEDLIVWMRTAALPTFRKLYGRIEVDLEANEEILVTLENNYNTYSFGGKKKLVLSTTSWLGGKNDFIGVAYISVGGLCFFLAMAFIIVYLIKPR